MNLTDLISQFPSYRSIYEAYEGDWWDATTDVGYQCSDAVGIWRGNGWVQCFDMMEAIR